MKWKINITQYEHKDNGMYTNTIGNTERANP